MLQKTQWTRWSLTAGAWLEPKGLCSSRCAGLAETLMQLCTGSVLCLNQQPVEENLFVGVNNNALYSCVVFVPVPPRSSRLFCDMFCIILQTRNIHYSYLFKLISLHKVVSNLSRVMELMMSYPALIWKWWITARVPCAPNSGLQRKQLAAESLLLLGVLCLPTRRNRSHFWSIQLQPT